MKPNLATRLLAPIFLAASALLLQAASAQDQPKDDPTVWVTRTGAKFHKASCQYAKKATMSLKRSEAVKRYSACSKCNP